MRQQDGEKEKESFVFYHEWADTMEELTDKERLAVFDAMVSYSRTGELPTKLSKAARVAFRSIKPDMDRNRKKWEDTCKKRSEAAKARWEKRGEGKGAKNAPRDVSTPDPRDSSGEGENKPPGVVAWQREEERREKWRADLYKRDDTGDVEPVTDRPTEEQVYEYMHMYTMGTLPNMRDEARKFIDYLDARGWKIKGSEIVNWQAEASNWIKKIKDYGNKREQAEYESARNCAAAIKGYEERARYKREHGEEELPF